LTTIAYKDGILAADTQLTYTDDTYGHCHKITKLPNDMVVACAGDTIKEHWFLKHLMGEKIPKDKMNFKGLQSIVIDSGNVFWAQGGIELIPIDDKFYAIGSGYRLARGAMSIGMNPKDAVKFASEVDIYTNNIVDVYDTKREKITYGK